MTLNIVRFKNKKFTIRLIITTHCRRHGSSLMETRDIDPKKQATIAYIGRRSDGTEPTPGTSVSAFYHLFATNPRSIGPTPRRMMCALSAKQWLVDKENVEYEEEHLLEVGKNLQAKHDECMHSFKTVRAAVPSGNNRMSMYELEAAMVDCGHKLVGDSVYDIQ